MRFSTQTKAVKAHCIGCIYDPLAGGSHLQQIENCPVTQCELYEWRPLTMATKARLKAEKYAAMSDVDKEKYRSNQEAAREQLKKTPKKVNRHIYAFKTRLPEFLQLRHEVTT